jgi:hypothetical protein
MKPIIILSVLLIATLSIGVDLAERIEMRARSTIASLSVPKPPPWPLSRS